MKYAYYKKLRNDMDYSRYFIENEPIDIHLKSKDWKGQDIYLAKKHKGRNTSTHASINNDYELIESYNGHLTRYEFINTYRPARQHFLWLREEELDFLTSNTKSKHVLQRWDD
jgi:hypothetical protein